MNKSYFFMMFVLGIFMFFFSFFMLLNPQVFFYYIIMIIAGLMIVRGMIAFIEWLFKKGSLLECIVSIVTGIGLAIYSKIPLTIIVVIFAIYLCIEALSHFLTYCYYRKENVSNRFWILLTALILCVVGISFLISPYIHTKDMTIILGVYLCYLSLKYMWNAVKEVLGENRKDSLKRKVRVSLPVVFVSLLPRIVVEYINEKLETDDLYEDDGNDVGLEVFIHVSKNGFGAIGHVDIAYQGVVLAYGAYDESSCHLFGSIGDGVLFQVDRQKYIDFCLKDDKTQHIFAYTLSLNSLQQQRVEQSIQDLNHQLIAWQPHITTSYAMKLWQNTQANFYKFKSGKFKTYFVMTTNCVLLADEIIGKSGIDIVNINGIITPGSYFDYFEEEMKKEHSRIVKREIYKNA